MTNYTLYAFQETQLVEQIKRRVNMNLTHLFDVQFNWTAIREGVKELLFIHSDNDPYVPLNQAQFVSTNTGAEMIVVPGESHFNLEITSQCRRELERWSQRKVSF